MDDLENMYKRRFGNEVKFRKKMWKILCKDFFQKYVPRNSTVLDVAAGYCEFINNIRAGKKIAIDLNEDAVKFADKDVEVINGSSTDMKGIEKESVDVAYTSNFFEHLERKEIVETIKEVYRVLKKGGRFLVLQPNIRYCYKDYWMFFDHLTPIDDRSLTEILELNGFKVVKCMPKFLPYTTKSKLPKSLFLLKIYLMFPFIQKILGKQAFVIARKI